MMRSVASARPAVSCARPLDRRFGSREARAVTIYSIPAGPDGLARVTVRRPGKAA